MKRPALIGYRDCQGELVRLRCDIRGRLAIEHGSDILADVRVVKHACVPMKLTWILAEAACIIRQL